MATPPQLSDTSVFADSVMHYLFLRNVTENIPLGIFSMGGMKWEMMVWIEVEMGNDRSGRYGGGEEREREKR